MSPRCAPLIALPLSCAIISRSAARASTQTGAPSGMCSGSTAIVRPSRHRPIHAAERSGTLGQVERPEEDEGRIVTQKLRHPLGMARAPVADHVRRHLGLCDLAAPHQFGTDGAVVVPVPAGKSEPPDPAVRQPHPDRALNLREERLDRAVEPDQFAPGQKVSRLDLGAVVPGAVERQVVRRGVERMAEARRPAPRRPRLPARNSRSEAQVACRSGPGRKWRSKKARASPPSGRGQSGRADRR